MKWSVRTSLFAGMLQIIKKTDEKIRMTLSKKQFPQGKTLGTKAGLQNFKTNRSQVLDIKKLFHQNTGKYLGRGPLYHKVLWNIQVNSCFHGAIFNKAMECQWLLIVVMAKILLKFLNTSLWKKVIVARSTVFSYRKHYQLQISMSLLMPVFLSLTFLAFAC